MSKKLSKNHSRRGGKLAITIAIVLAIVVLTAVVATIVALLAKDKTKGNEDKPSNVAKVDIMNEVESSAVNRCESLNKLRTNESKHPIVDILDASLNEDNKLVEAQSGDKWQTNGQSKTGKEDIKPYNDVGGGTNKLVMPSQDCWLEISGEGRYDYAVYYDFANLRAKAKQAKSAGYGENGAIGLTGVNGNFMLLSISSDNKTGRPYYELTGKTKGDVTMRPYMNKVKNLSQLESLTVI